MPNPSKKPAKKPAEAPYQEETPPNWNADVLRNCNGGYQHKGTEYTLKGKCPFCEHQDGISEWYDGGGVRFSVEFDASVLCFDRPVEEPPDDVWIQCKCRVIHPGSEKDSGCGRGGWVTPMVVEP